MVEVMKNRKEYYMQSFYACIKKIKYQFIIGVLLSFLLCGCGDMSKIVTAIEHPFEAIFSPRHLVELQHGVQQQNSGRDDTTLVWSTSNHTISDRSSELFSKNSPYERIQVPEGIFLLFYLANNDAAYNMTLARNAGKHGENYNLLFYDYDHSGWCPVVLKIDAISNILYSYNYIIYIPYKIMRRFSCTIDEDKCPGLGFWSFLDGIWGIFIAVVEAVVAFFVGICGLVTGAICHPIDTICNIIPGIFFIFWDLLCAICAFLISVLELFLSFF